ncbi:MAG TPA: DNA ligase D [Hyphomonadaceae bacterium]|jgi:bifunctional non-homologous end joining protein LigD|nr:DNA ligase D [Hyphomonadaceae bacterium]
MADGLSKYRSMRDFKSTPEPRGKTRKSKTGNLYIIQKHDATRLHYDFRLELDGVLLSWAVTRGPSLNPADKRLAIHTEDHPIEYGGFEGVIPKGYGAGTVMLWDRGVWAPQGDPHEGMKKGNFKFVLMGERLKGGFALVRLKPKPGEKSKNEPWLLIKERDQWADGSVVATEEWETSVKSGRDLDRIETQGEKYKRGKAYSPVAKTRAKTVAAKAAKAAVRLAKTATAKPKRTTAKAKGAAKRSPGKKQLPKGKPLDGPRAAPRFIAPQLATLEAAPPQGSEWLHEIKFDGYRIITVIKDGKVTLFTRNHLDWTHKYGRIREALEQLGLTDAVLDGELVAHDKSGKAAFSLMHAAVDDESIPLIYTLFDLLNDGGHDIRKLPLTVRKERLKVLLANAPDIIRYSDHIGGKGEAVIAQACRLDLEGVISKKADAPYISGRGLSWIKSKCIGSDEFVIGGYRLSDKQGRAFRSLLLGEFQDGKLIYRGRVGTGFNDETFRMLMPKFKRLQVKASPFEDTPADARRNAVWVKPQIVAQVAYLEVTPDGHLRHPSYLGLREDKPAKAVRTGSSVVSLADKRPKKKARVVAVAVKAAKKVAPKHVAKPAKKSGPTKLGSLRLTSPDKLLWADAGVTKLDLARYYHDMAKHILPHVKDRPLSLVRCPEGYEGECFFQKHHNPSTPDAIDTVKIKEKDGKSNDYLVIRDAAGVVGAAQIGGLELHVWGSRTDSLEKPERIVFDLDPDEGLDFGDVKKAAVELRDVLESVGLKSFPMLTGGKGVHVIVPIARTQEWPQVKAFASGLARKLAAHSPDKYLAQASKAKRKGRIFIDWLRNERGATAVAPFSPRRRKGAPVATPISWQELNKFDTAAAFTMATIEARLSKLRSDPWKGYAQAARQALKAAAIEAVSEA